MINAHMAPTHTQLVLGLPGAGKTTFIAALRHVTEVGDVPDALRLAALGTDDAFVNLIKGQWQRCETLTRTLPEEERTIRLRLSEPDDESNMVELDFPDLSGELIEQQWSLRRYAESYGDLARSARGILLFIHPEAVVAPTRIADANAAMIGLLDGAPEEQTTTPKPRPYNARDSATQLKLVDLLQTIVEIRNIKGPAPLAVIVSAWDRVETLAMPAPAPLPEDWLSRSLPLLHQFLRANATTFDWCVFGLSAQGGDLESDIVSLQSVSPSARIRLVDGRDQSHNLTKPIQWIELRAGSRT